MSDIKPDAIRERVVALTAELAETLADPTQAWDIAVKDFVDEVEKLRHEPGTQGDQIKVRIVNIYEDGDEITTEETAYVTVPEGDDLADWAYDQLFPLTGTGRTEGNSAYFLTIIEFSARPDLVGQEFEFGV